MNVRRKIGALTGAAALTAGLGVALVGSPAQAAYVDCTSGGTYLCAWNVANGGAAGVQPTGKINADNSDLTNTAGFNDAVSLYNRRANGAKIYTEAGYTGFSYTLNGASASDDLGGTAWYHHVRSIDLL